MKRTYMNAGHYYVTDKDAGILARAVGRKLPPVGQTLRVEMPDGRLAWLARSSMVYARYKGVPSLKRGWVWSVLLDDEVRASRSPKRTRRSPSAKPQTSSRPPCECGDHDASWHGTDGYRVYLCDACWKKHTMARTRRSPSKSEGNLPPWPGASSVYSYLYRVLEKRSNEAYLQRKEAGWHRKKTKADKARDRIVSDEFRDVISALNKGDEETLKAIQMHYRQMGY